MKKNYFLLLISFLFSAHMYAQTTETFETETAGSTTFTDNGKAFNITSQMQGPFDIYSSTTAYGWNGTSADTRFIDNTGGTAFNSPVQFTISGGSGMAFNLKSFYLFMSTNLINLNVSGSLIITGKLGGVTKFTATANSPFNTNLNSANGFTFINMSSFGGQNNANNTIDQFVVTTTGNIAYVALDAMTWQCPSVTVSPVSQTNVACFGSNTGAATVSAAGGSGFTYDWAPGNPAGDGTATATGLTAGTWTVTVTNSCGSSNSTSVTISQPGTAVTATQSQTNVTCNGLSNGSATVSASGGTGSYSYSWLPSGGNGPTASNRPAGNYTVTITDGNGCSIQKSFNITQPNAIAATQSQSNVSCNGGSNGSATVSPSGGTGTYTYSWSPAGGTGATASNLSAGNYTVTITDTAGCSIQRFFTLTSPGALTATQSQTNISCNNGSNGTATVTASGGTNTYSYSWAPSGGTASTASNLSAGNYTVTITDSNNCSIQKFFTITAPAAVAATQSQTNVSCNGGSNGTATVTASGGTGSYTYAWTPAGGTGATASNLPAGNYTVTIYDVNGCSTQKFFTITAPSALSASQSQVNLSCNGNASGSATVSAVSGGTGSYTYSWSPFGGTGATASGLSAGNYTVTIADANNCTIQRFFTITEPDGLTATQSQTNISCDGATDGTATVAVTGGTGTYTYSWSPLGGSAATATGLTAGTYTVTITDANNCSIQKQFTIGTAADCTIATTWNGNSWNNGVPVCNTYAATIDGDYNSAVHGEIVSCSLTVNSGNVTVAGGDNFTIKGVVAVNGGSLTFEQNSNLVQTDDVTNTGTITYNRNSSAVYGLDYTIWSSPVTGSQTLKDFSPQTLDERFYVYNTALAAYSNYLSASGIFGGNPDEETFVAAKGYLIRMPDGLDPDATSIFNGSFTGTPNNGDISIGLNTQNTAFNAVGNPYPSPINVQEFLTLNEPNLDNGTLYFWRKRNGATGSAYATVTLAGYIASSPSGEDTSAGVFNSGQEANWVINPGQGFIVKAATTATALNFNNTMRRAFNNGQFFRTNTANRLPPLTGPTSKFWLDITNENNDFGQTAVAYTDVTTSGLDYAYDGRLVNDGIISLYSVAEDTKLAIQARNSFTSDDEVKMGYKVTTEGNYSIAISQRTGVFDDGQKIFLRDALLNLDHDLTLDNYTFTSDAGTFDDRFKVVYSPTLGLNENVLNADSILIYQNSNTIVITSGTALINEITIYDLRGRAIYKRDKVKSTSAEVNDLVAEEQMLIVKVKVTDGTTVSKKIIH